MVFIVYTNRYEMSISILRRLSFGTIGADVKTGAALQKGAAPVWVCNRPSVPGA